jgi:hypothetical protein
MPQRVHRDALVDTCGDRGGVHGAVQLPVAQRLDRVQARKRACQEFCVLSRLIND